MTPRLLLIDNYDSFTYNLVQAFLVLGAEVSVYRNDALTPQQARALQPTHLCSTVTGQLQPGKTAFDALRACLPAGTLSGAPKVRAMQIIDELEPVSRGLYGGTVGYFGASGDMDHAITIRTLVFKGDEYSYQAGAGIVADSVPQNEHDEVLAKSAAMVRALELAEEGL